MDYVLPDSKLIAKALEFGWVPPIYWRVEVIWKKFVRDHPEDTAGKYIMLCGEDYRDEIMTELVQDPDTLCDEYIDEVLENTPIGQRGPLFEDVFNILAERYIWNYFREFLFARVRREVMAYIEESAHQSSPIDEEVPPTAADLFKDFIIYIEAKQDIKPLNTYIIVSGNKSGLTYENSCQAETVNEALRIMDYGPGGLENKWECMIDDSLKKNTDKFDKDDLDLHAYALSFARCFFGLEPDKDSELWGNFIDGDSNSAYKLLIVDPKGITTSHP
jgi:hypothetical protein